MTTEQQYIDPNELKAMVNGDINRCYQLRIDGIGALSHFMDQINSCKTVDAVEVVRCKDCKYQKRPLFAGNGIYCVENRRHFELDDFCSYGERKHDDCI